MINSLPFFLWVKSGNISRKFLTFILKIFDKNFERLQIPSGHRGYYGDAKEAGAVHHGASRAGETGKFDQE